MDISNFELSFASVIALMVTGIVYGFTVCSFSCFPVIATYVIGTNKGFKDSLIATLLFSVAKLTAYILIGAICAVSGMFIFKWVEPKIIATIIGMILITTGTLLFLRKKHKHCCHAEHKCISIDNYKQVLVLGFISGLIPCPPYIALMSTAAVSGSLSLGLWGTLAFGVGNLISPLILMGGVMGLFSNKIHLKIQKYSSLSHNFNAILFILLGVAMFLQANLQHTH